LDLPGRETVAEFEGPTVHLGGDGPALGQLITQPAEGEHIPLGQVLIARVIGELEGEDTEVREVLPMDPRQGLRHDHSQPEVAGSDDRVLTRRTLPVVLTADDGMTA